MNILLGIFIFITTSSLLMVAYVWVRDIQHKRLLKSQAALTDDEFFEEIKTAESVITEYDYRQKTA